MSTDTERLERLLESACYHLLWVWAQYSEYSRMDKADPENGKVHLTHACTQAGERATDFLETLGYGYDQGWEFRANARGCALMLREEDNDGILLDPTEATE